MEIKKTKEQKILKEYQGDDTELKELLAAAKSSVENTEKTLKMEQINNRMHIPMKVAGCSVSKWPVKPAKAASHSD